MSNPYLINYYLQASHMMTQSSRKIFLLIILAPLSLYALFAQESTVSTVHVAQSDTTIKADTLTIYFDHEKYALKDTFVREIRKIADKLLSSYNKILYIHGYTDHTGSQPFNKWLSKKRASKVRDALLRAGVPENLIESVEGKGEIERDIPESQRIPQDRRVQLVLTERKVQQVDLSEIDIEDFEAGDAFIIKNLNFKPGRHILLDESVPQLRELLQILKKYPDLKIELQGHVCCAPKDEDGLDLDTQSQDLSVNRAKNIYEYLVRNGIDSNRLSYKGFAKTRPLYPEERNEYEKKMNRRVEIEVVGN